MKPVPVDTNNGRHPLQQYLGHFRPPMHEPEHIEGPRPRSQEVAISTKTTNAWARLCPGAGIPVNSGVWAVSFVPSWKAQPRVSDTDGDNDPRASRGSRRTARARHLAAPVRQSAARSQLLATAFFAENLNIQEPSRLFVKNCKEALDAHVGWGSRRA